MLLLSICVGISRSSHPSRRCIVAAVCLRAFAGWTSEETDILRLAIMKFGVGSWSKIIQAQCLPGKTPAQLNLQTQRMLGQQSLAGAKTLLIWSFTRAQLCAEFMGIHLDARKVWQFNNQKQGPEYKRKNGCIINTGSILRVFACSVMLRDSIDSVLDHRQITRQCSSASPNSKRM